MRPSTTLPRPPTAAVGARPAKTQDRVARTGMRGGCRLRDCAPISDTRTTRVQRGHILQAQTCAAGQPRPVRAGNHRFGLLSALRAHTNAPYKTLRWRSLSALDRPREAPDRRGLGRERDAELTELRAQLTGSIGFGSVLEHG
jgi:hypothetical protein